MNNSKRYNNYFSYISYFKQFKPLSKQQIYQLLEAKNKPHVVNTLALHHMWIVLSIVRRYYESVCFANGVDPSELVNAGFIAIRKLIKKYDLSKGWSIQYVKNYIRGTIKNEYAKLTQLIRYPTCKTKKKVRMNNYQRNNNSFPIQIISLNSIRFHNDNGEAITWEETIPDTKEYTKQQLKILTDEILSLIEKNFSSEARKIIEMRFGIGRYINKGMHSYYELERKIGKSRETIRLIIEKEIMPWLRTILHNSNNLKGQK